MTEFIGYVQELLGAVPAGYEPLQYVVGAALLVVLCVSAASMLFAIFRWIGGM